MAKKEFKDHLETFDDVLRDKLREIDRTPQNASYLAKIRAVQVQIVGLLSAEDQLAVNAAQKQEAANG